MSLFPRLGRSAPSVGRPYSSFFSKPGGGRYFNSAKPPKPVLQPGRGKADNNNNSVSSADTNPKSPPANRNGRVKAGGVEEPTPVLSFSGNTSLPLTSSPSFFDRIHVLTHPSISSKEYKLHQFFSLHRPLLLLNQPTSVIFESPDPSAPLFALPADQVNNQSQEMQSLTSEDPPESSPEADADAARQLAHTLVMNCVGGTIAWQETLSHIGLTAEKGDMTLAKESAQEWVGIHADSTRRKKRKKMKKHKCVPPSAHPSVTSELQLK
ncbi:hypothetical protein PAXRUDRAFT_357252 [Paxillus rubicundulus Ve08.2h10]|uniref:Uncharacterized protein n=1 Tax=Paxillus rubicundulus Ve08.2h10 TaxID=930991 RepID=A0A0D0EB40_9AGAM|nr:hypothetical protein PAXRUDRAFT_357252 [Paxillus rubicundulus Ve08.2h10]